MAEVNEMKIVAVGPIRADLSSRTEAMTETAFTN